MRFSDKFKIENDVQKQTEVSEGLMHVNLQNSVAEDKHNTEINDNAQNPIKHEHTSRYPRHERTKPKYLGQ